MLSPNPLSLLCAVLLCLPLALVFTITGDDTTTSTTTNSNVAVAVAAAAAATATLRRDHDNPVSMRVLLPTSRNRRNPQNRPPESKSILSYNESPEKAKPYLAARTSEERPPAPPTNPPPPILSHEEEDEDATLFRVASKANPNPSLPNSAKKVAFMFMTTTPLPFAPLWEMFFNQSKPKYYNIYIHADPSFDYNPPFTGMFSGSVIPSSKRTRRNTPTLISAARRLLSHALLHDPANYMFALLSSVCIPLHSFKFTYRTLVTSRKSFIEILKNETTAYGRWAARGEDAMLPEVGLDDFRIGSQFWVLTRKHATVVVRDRMLWEKFKLPCLRPDTCYPEENYFPTLLSMVDPRGVVPATLTHVDWRGRHDGHPRRYNASEVAPGLIERLRREKPRYGDFGVGSDGPDSSVAERSDPFLFARKFAPDSLRLLLSIANDVVFKD
ncbi:hypothetical protein Nepgr_008861 [Nepenthes gracilis]|uniref:Core-2/I-branching beta-1,6-N-acetylglucosaminyltransferase family protein n=1 Tax=Nepenthes gracilis TaxID=150966 RepID=A0AAD3XJV6_NEPGR|nr:hypothetical protein Nepgr_008861 [Nepenthes gracilis]